MTKLKYALISLSFLSNILLAQPYQEPYRELEDKTTALLSLEQAVIAAQSNDPWLVGNRHSQDAIESMSVAAGTLPDPKISLGLANIAADSFDFGQEAMTQFKVGVSQMFPRGDSLAIKQQQLKLQASQFPYLREDRKARVAVIVAKLWLDAFEAQESIALIENDRALFEQLADIAQASYSSTVGKTRQQDIIRAQLELTRLDDRLSKLKQKQEISQKRLSEWLSEYLNGRTQDQTTVTAISDSSFLVARLLPNIAMLEQGLFTSKTDITPQMLSSYFSKHPAVNALNLKIRTVEEGIKLAKQKYKPEWGVNASYGYRDTNPLGIDRSDLFSIGVSFDLPLFASNRQDKQVQSAVSRTSAVKTEKWLLIRRFIASFEAIRSQLLRLNERQNLYQERLLPQMHDQAEASLTAYTNDDGDFSEVVRSRIAELNASIDSLGINVQRQKSIIQLNYFFMRYANEIVRQVFGEKNE
ncbi:MAG: transporter [Gammaproteobacteria bacterium]|nr:MAG: transporter [Gammaproteobacteria bacterium]